MSGLFAGSSRTVKQLFVITVDIASAIFTAWLSFSIKYDDIHYNLASDIYVYIASLIISLPIFHRFGLYRSVYRYTGFASLSLVSKACFIYGIILFSLILLLNYFGIAIPRSIGILQPLLLLMAVGSTRAMARIWFHPANKNKFLTCSRENIMIYGAGDAGIQIACALQHNANYNVAGFLDDDPRLYEKVINGITVYDPLSIKELVEINNIKSILIALPSATRKRRKEIYSSLEKLNIHIRTLPGIEALADGKITINDIREIDIEDLLGRDPVVPEPDLIKKCIEGKTVLVTGAGGSIGSELCRQILQQKPKRLILLDQSEFNLYALQKELEEKSRENILIAKLADITDKAHIDKIFYYFRPETVYHAAAYKHVPLVEENPFEGIRNNVFGTLYVTEASKKYGVKYLVLISTDKAVRPTNIMGASKRISELIIQGIAAETKNTNACFSMVRFGNVLGSSGSVVPLFRQQISKGGPITITNREVTRYFMTLPEAAQLVIQAGAMASGGDVFLLDMGEPVRIIELAKRMIELSGLSLKTDDNPDGDIDIKITGLRAGEKLYEELLIGESPIPTEHKRIFKAHEKYIDMYELRGYLHEMEDIIYDGKYDIEKMKEILKRVVTGYHSKENNEDYLENNLVSKSLIF